MVRKTGPVTVALVLAAALFSASYTTLAEAASTTVIVMQDQAALRGAPRDSAPVQATLWRGEALEVRAERADYLQVWDHQRERGGYVHRGLVHAIGTSPADAAPLLSALRFIVDVPGAESLGLGLAAAYVQAAPSAVLAGPDGATALEAMGRLAERLADRASHGTAKQSTLSAHLDVATRYGLRFISREKHGRMQMCVDGEVFRRVLSLPASPEQRARAALALTRPDCMEAQPGERERLDVWRADVLDRVDSSTVPAVWRNRLAMRRAAVWSSLAYAQARRGANTASDSTQRALAEIATVDKSELADEDQGRYNDAAMRVNGVRWAYVSASAASAVAAANAGPLAIEISTAPDGQTCVALTDKRLGEHSVAVRRCTWGVVWAASLNIRSDKRAVTLAVTPTDGWRELWLFQRGAQDWAVQVLPPAAATPDVGYAEHAGWVPGGQQLLVAREAMAEGRYKRSFEVVSLASLNTERQAGDAKLLGAFQRWSDAAWRRDSLSQR